MLSEAIKNDWWFIGYDETHHWNLDALDLKDRVFLSKIVTVYAVNRAEHTHCCELTPSYNLCAVAHEPVFTTGVDAPEAARECIWNFVNQVPVVESSHYRHVRCVDRYVENNPVMVYRVGELDVEDYPTTREQEDRMIDIWHSNPKF